MYPHLFSIPMWIFAVLMGAALGATLGGKSNRAAIIGGAIGALLSGLIASRLPIGQNVVPVQGYGVMILLGFSLGIAQAEWRAPLLGVKHYHVLDMGLTGAFLGIGGARIFHIAENWS